MIAAASNMTSWLAAQTSGGVTSIADMPWAGWILWLPAIACVLCGLCAAMRVKNKAPGFICVGFLGVSFIVTLALYLNYESPVTIHLFDWINIEVGGGAPFVGNFALYIDSLTLLWMLFVTGLGTMIALYATEYMEPDVGKGYARFFAGVSIFLFAMGSLVMGDNLLMLYLGWEGVGFASYWLIGYYYTRPAAVAAAKKAFIMNRIGDLGLALAIYLIYHYFGTLQYNELFAAVESQFGSGPAAAEAASEVQSGGWMLKVIPFLLMLGAFGKSAQLPLYVWLPDAMEGPTPVSALIHAATMVTAGVYLLCRMFPIMELNAAALPTVAWIGGVTALLAATIGMAQYDIKRIMAYSTVSQLGYMFVGIGVLTTYGAGYHVFTHAFFKAVLFLTCGAIMHGFAGQLDLRKLSGLRRIPGWRIVSYTMLVGCLCLAGFPLTSGFFSKDAILAEAFVSGYQALGWLMIFTAGLTAYYAFRVWFRVCAGPIKYEMGDEHHGDDDGHHDDHDDHGHDKPHAPRLAINLTLVVLAVGALLAAFAGGWAKKQISGSSAGGGVPVEHHGEEAGQAWLFGMNPHQAMYWVSGAVAIIGIAIAFWFHLKNRAAADSLRDKLLGNPATRWLPIAMENKWYVDEFYDFLIRKPLWVFSFICYGFDRFIIDLVCVDGIARIPRMLGRAFQPLQNGVLQSYAVSMAGGVGLIAILVFYMPELITWLNTMMGGQS